MSTIRKRFLIKTESSNFRLSLLTPPNTSRCWWKMKNGCAISKVITSFLGITGQPSRTRTSPNACPPKIKLRRLDLRPRGSEHFISLRPGARWFREAVATGKIRTIIEVLPAGNFPKTRLVAATTATKRRRRRRGERKRKRRRRRVV